MKSKSFMEWRSNSFSLPSLQCCRDPLRSIPPFQTGICLKPLLPWLRYPLRHCWLSAENSKERQKHVNQQCQWVQKVLSGEGLTGLMSLRKPLGTSEGSSGFLCLNLEKNSDTLSVSALPTLSKGRTGRQAGGFICDLQSFIKAHFTHQRLADPVDEGLWFFCNLRTAAVHLQFHNLPLSILTNNSKKWAEKQKEKNSSSVVIFLES